MRFITADKIFDGEKFLEKNTVIILDDSGKIIDLQPLYKIDPIKIQFLKGVISPGFINAHCHLELSHMKGIVPTGTGLIPFITNVVTKRNMDADYIQDCIQKADLEMQQNGIVAVGDISNVTDTFSVKYNSNLHYHTFIEHFDFLQDQNAVQTFNQYNEVFQVLILKDGDLKSKVPHASYSVSPTLFQLIENEQTFSDNITQSIHNQETPPEIELFQKQSGDFYDFYGKFGISLEHFHPKEKNELHYAIHHLNKNQNILLVHNTLTSKSDINWAKQHSDKLYFATCPNANLYIENRLPNYQNFINTEANVCIGTDSLTSNWSLSILEEMKTIRKYQSYVDSITVLKWATSNGAKALHFDNKLGTIEVGKSPGLNLLTGYKDIEECIDNQTIVTKIV